MIDFGKGLELAGMDRPLHAECIAVMNVTGGKIAFARPGIDDLAPLLLNAAEVHERACWTKANFLGKLSHSGLRKIFTDGGFAFWDGPVAFIFLREEWAARVGEQEFHIAAAAAVDQQSSALKPRHGRRLA